MNTQEKLETSDRCKLFEQIAEEVWKRINRAHEVGVDLHEEGITRDILVDILQFSKYQKANFNVYAKKGENENVYGSDIDIYVETIKGHYKRYALQAKILKKNKRYTTLRDGYTLTNPTYQWEKLELLVKDENEKKNDISAFYLLYNGMERATGFVFKETDSCGRAYLESQLGCSLVKLNDMRKLALKTNSKNGCFVSPKYDNIHPELSDPWRTIVCCKKIQKEGYNLYKEEDVKNDIIGYDKLDSKDENIENIDLKNDNTEEEKQAIESKVWNPLFKIIIKRSDNIAPQ